MTALDCPWCKAGTFGHECATRDYWLDVEDSELPASRVGDDTEETT